MRTVYTLVGLGMLAFCLSLLALAILAPAHGADLPREWILPPGARSIDVSLTRDVKPAKRKAAKKKAAPTPANRPAGLP